MKPIEGRVYWVVVHKEPYEHERVVSHHQAEREARRARSEASGNECHYAFDREFTVERRICRFEPVFIPMD